MATNYSIYTNSSLVSRRAAGPHGNLNRERPARPGPAAAPARHHAWAGAGPAADVAVWPPRAQARDAARPVARRTPRPPSRHGAVLHNRLHDGRPGQHAQAGGQLRHQHQRTHRRHSWERRLREGCSIHNDAVSFDFISKRRKRSTITCVGGELVVA